MSKSKFRTIESIGDILKSISDSDEMSRGRRLLNLEKANLIKKLREIGIEDKKEIQRSVKLIEDTKKFLRGV